MVVVSGMASPRTQLTRTPAAPYSAASERVMASITPQVADMAAMNGIGVPLSEADSVTIDPCPCAAITRAAARLVRNVDPRMTRSGRWKASMSRSAECAG